MVWVFKIGSHSLHFIETIQLQSEDKLLLSVRNTIETSIAPSYECRCKNQEQRNNMRMNNWSRTSYKFSTAREQHASKIPRFEEFYEGVEISETVCYRSRARKIQLHQAYHISFPIRLHHLVCILVVL